MTAKTAVIYRPLFGMEVKQDIDTMFYNATDVLKAYNSESSDNKRLQKYLEYSATAEFIKQLKIEGNLKHPDRVNKNKPYSPLITKRGKYGGTRMHSKLLLDFMMRLSPEMKSRAYDFILEGFGLAGKRNELKEGYKKMSKAICDTGNSNYREEARMINLLVTGSTASNQRARLPKEAMELMDDLQKVNASLIRSGMNIEQRRDVLLSSL